MHAFNTRLRRTRMRTSVLNTVLAVALVVGTGACKGPDTLTTDLDHYAGFARGANVVPAATDTTPAGQVNVTTNTTANTITFTFTTSGMPGTLDSVALYKTAAGATLAAQASAILCAGAAACATPSGTATYPGSETATTIRSSMRGYGTQVVFFTTTTRAAGAARGTMYTNPQ
jgi:hypothetical protein